MQLYEISSRYIELFNAFDNAEDLDEDMIQTYFDTLEGIESEFEDKAVNTALYFKNLNSHSQAIKNEIDNLITRKKLIDNKAQKLKQYLLEMMKLTNNLKIDNPKVQLSIRKSPESVYIFNENEFIEYCQKNNLEKLLTYKAPVVSKTAVKNLIKQGEEIPNVTLMSGQSLIIK